MQSGKSLKAAIVKTMSRKGNRSKRGQTNLAALKSEAPVRNNEGRRYFMKAVKTLTKFPKNTATNLTHIVQSGKAVSKLKNLIEDFDLEKAESCLEMMQKFESNAEVQALGCNSLAAIAVQESTGLMQMGVVDALLKAMEHHAKSKKVQAAASLLVWNLAVKDEHKKLLASHGVPDNLIKALEAHEGDKTVQLMAIGAMKILANDKSIKQRLANAGGIELIVKALKKFKPENGDEGRKAIAQLHETCISALMNFAFGNECVELMMKMHVPKYISDSMELFSDEAEVLGSACGALWNLSIAKENKLEIAELGVSASVIKAMQAFAESDLVVLNSMGLLKNLCIYQASRLIVLRSYDLGGLEKILENCVIIHGDHPDITRIGYELLDILYEVQESAEDEDIENIDDEVDDDVVNIDD